MVQLVVVLFLLVQLYYCNLIVMTHLQFDQIAIFIYFS